MSIRQGDKILALVRNIGENVKVKMLTKTQYLNLEEKDPGVLYAVIKDNEL